MAHAVNNGTMSVLGCFNNVNMLPEIERELNVSALLIYIPLLVIYLVILGKIEKKKKA